MGNKYAKYPKDAIEFEEPKVLEDEVIPDYKTLENMYPSAPM
jgi:hypothetical protein